MTNPATTNVTKKKWGGNHSVVIECANCGAKKEKFASQLSGYGGHYCSRKCYHEARAKGKSLPNQTGERNPFWKGGASSVEHTCKRCGKKFVASAANKRQYCSLECWYIVIDKADSANKLRRRPGYYSWRAHTIHKSDGVCAACGEIGNHAHHLLPIEHYPDLRANKQNGMSLCEKHHWSFHRGNGGGGVQLSKSWLGQVLFFNELLLGI